MADALGAVARTPESDVIILEKRIEQILALLREQTRRNNKNVDEGQQQAAPAPSPSNRVY